MAAPVSPDRQQVYQHAVQELDGAMEKASSGKDIHNASRQVLNAVNSLVEKFHENIFPALSGNESYSLQEKIRDVQMIALNKKKELANDKEADNDFKMCKEAMNKLLTHDVIYVDELEGMDKLTMQAYANAKYKPRGNWHLKGDSK